MNRRYDIDWLRVFALGLLIIYHISIVFQPWAYFIYFPQSEKPIESIWLVMGLINIWRIPLLFVISGMGVYLAMRSRNWKELIKDRTKRILLPLIFGSLIIVPIHVYIYQAFTGLGSAYFPGPGHLWFLGNILFYGFPCWSSIWIKRRSLQHFIGCNEPSHTGIPHGSEIFAFRFSQFQGE